MEYVANRIEEVSLQEIKSQVKEISKAKENLGEKVQLIVFKLGDEKYAININHIREVVSTPPIAKIPQAPDYIKGVANIRGSIIAILNLEERFKLLQTPDSGTNSYTFVVESDRVNMGVLVREVPSTLTTYTSKIDTASNVMKHSALDSECIIGVVKDQESLVILLDVYKLITVEEASKTVKI